jgi:hypothetical protein
MLTRKSHRKSSKHHSTRHQSVKEDATSKKLTKIALAISLAFILSYLPHLALFVDISFRLSLETGVDDVDFDVELLENLLLN